MQPVPTTLPPGHRVAHYEIIRTIGEGGMGVVYLAQDGENDREVALKVLHSDIAGHETKRKRFLREGKFLNALTHPGIATVFEVGEADNRIYIAMEFVEGTTLKQIISVGRLGVERSLKTGTEVANALAQAHAAGIVHRDLKPDNIIINADKNAKLLDFGIAKAADSAPVMGDNTTTELTTRGQLLGTPAYMSPEQAKGLEVDQRSDVFSMGILLYEMLTGRRPFQGDTWQELIIAVNRDTPEPATQIDPSIPPELDRLVAKCLMKEKENRYHSCVEVASDLEAIFASFRRQKRMTPAHDQPAAVLDGEDDAAPTVAQPNPMEMSGGPGQLPRLPPAPAPPTARVPRRRGLFAQHPWLVIALVFVLLVAVTIAGMAVFIRAKS